ncbi:MAG: M20 family metallopeptidase [Kofleriaceae bacterium]|jgi:glutamate carboxypeptidase|nr:M20 family metallopeptidase [Kofleriaceae bacterium]MBP9166981.1 M20 family metallopeptidase [Kofleriaceae bacterium]MBP9858292.1 M20 family metallopeptidase [Kofleriaceae bacterium]
MTDLVDRALAAADARAAELLPLLERWVKINSYTGNVAGCNQVADELLAGFALPGLTARRLAGDGVGDHLVWTTPAWARAAPEARVVMIGHHDTVFPPGTFEVWERDGDRLRGPGVLDMKGGLATIRTALAALADLGALVDLPLALCSVADEETGSNHSRPLLEELARGAGAALVFESGRATDQIVVARKGTGKIRVEVTGRAAHAGNNLRDGRNALWAVARMIDVAQRQTDWDRGVTVNVGLAAGGTSANTVPEHAHAELDFRYVRAVDGHALLETLTAAAAAIDADLGTTTRLTGGIRRAPLEPSEASRALLARYEACARAEGLGGGEAPLQGGGSDANTVSAIGVPAIDALGPRGKGFHTHDEYIEVPTLAQRTRALVRLLATWPR